MATLRAAFDEASAGRGGSVLISGEPGIGKTRLVEEFAAGARHTGALILWGRAFDGDGAPAFWPWLQVLRELADRTAGDGSTEPSRLATALDAVDSESRRLVEPHAVRFRLFDRIARLLRERTKDRILVVVFDDLHWADPPSLALLHFLAGDLRRMRLLVVVTYRDVEVHRSHPLVPVLAELSRQPGSTRVPLSGLNSAEVASYMDLVAGRRVPAALAARVHAETQGNPFFVSEVVRLLAAEGRLSSSGEWRLVLPPTVRATIRCRLAKLPARLIRALEVAAVVGREFPAATVERLCGRDALVELLCDGVEASVITPVPPACGGRYRFVHTLVREALYDELTPMTRRHIHHLVGQTLMELASPSGEPYLIEIAHHLLQALPDSDPEQAVRYLLIAAERAYRLLAYEEAVRLYDAARVASESHLSGDRRRRCQILLGLGEALMRSDRAADARPVLREAAELARGLGSSELLGRAALALGDPWPVMGAVNGELLALCEEAAAEAAPALRVRLLARSAIELYWGGGYERRLALSEQALALATRIDDPAALAHALLARHWALYGPDHLAERLEIASRMLRLGERAGDDELVLQGRHWRIVDLLEVASIAEVDFEIAAYAELATRLSHPFARWQLELRRALRALLDGRFADAEQLIDHAYVLGRRQDPRTAAGYHACQRFQLFRARGGVAELTTEIGRLIEENPTIPGFLALLAVVHIESGHPEQARQILARVSANRFAALPRDYNWLGSMALLAEVCGELGETSAAAVALRALRPYAGRAALFGRPSFCLGSVARPLGILAGTLGRFPEAELYFEQALAANARMGATAYVAHTQADYARMLTSRGGPRDADRAAQMRARAVTTAAELGMRGLSRVLETGPGPVPAGLTAREVEVLRLVAAGRSNREIAEALSISLNTVLRHVTHILTKTGSTNRTQAARFASSHSLLVQS